MDIITVEDLWKSYLVKERRFLLVKNTKLIEALRGVSFQVSEGEFLGYLGPNGSGKSTTIKILTGIMHPDHGKVNALGFIPWKQRREYTKHIGVVLGQKSQLWWDLPVKDSLWLFKKIYNVSKEDFNKKINEFDEMLDLKKILEQPVRKLSFGQRIKAEIAASLLHDPEIVFLDEPTIGLDVMAKESIRNFLKFVNKEYGTTVMLTTHDLGDVEALCKRIILILEGRIRYDGSLSKFKRAFGRIKLLEIEFDPSRGKELKDILLGSKAVITKLKDGYATAEVKENKLKGLVENISTKKWVHTFNVTEPKLEEVVKRMYKTS